MANIISGKELSARLKADMAAEVATFGAKYGRVPHLTVILVGEDPGSVSYVTGKAKASAEVGIRNTTIRKPATIAEEELLGIIAGLLGAVTSVELEAKGIPGVLTAMLIATPIAVVLGWGYGLLLNKVKGEEMMIATYVGFSSVAFMCIMWLMLPYSSSNMVWGYAGKGLRTTVSVEEFWQKAISDIGAFNLGDSFYFPTGMFLFFLLLCGLMWVFMRTRTGTAMTTVGSNPEYAKASGVNINRMRTLSVILSTWLGALGIIVYEQSFGFIQLYMGPFMMAFPAVAALLIGGASVKKASIVNVVVGTFLFQGILTMTPSVINSMLQTDMSEVIRIIVSNGMILYALTRVTKVRS